MAPRTPIEAPARGGATPGSVQNRAAYMRPALDNQNSRMLAKAFSQINASFGRIAANERRLVAKSQAEELALAKEEQAEAEARASELGKISGMTGQEFDEALVMNPNSLAVYQENQVIGQASKAATDFATQVQLSPQWGDPDQTGAFQSAWTDAATQAITAAPVGVQQEVAALWSQSYQASASANITASAEEMIRRETKAISEITYGLAMQADPTNPQAFMDALLVERDKARDARGNRGNRMFTDGLISMMGIIQATEDVSVTAPLARLMADLIDNVDDPAFSKSFIREFNLEDQARLKTASEGLLSHVTGILEDKQREEKATQDKAFSDLTAQALANPSGFRASLPQLVEIYGGDTEIALKQHEHITKFIDRLEDAGRESDPVASNQALSELIQRKNRGQYEDIESFYTEAFQLLTAGDFNILLKHEANAPSPLDLSLEYDLFKKNIRGLTGVLEKITENKFTSFYEMTDLGQRSRIAIQMQMNLELYELENRAAWETALKEGPEAQRKFIENAKNYALEIVLQQKVSDEGGTLKDSVLDYYAQRRDELEKDLVAKAFFKDYIDYLDGQDDNFNSDMVGDFTPAVNGENEDDGIPVPTTSPATVTATPQQAAVTPEAPDTPETATIEPDNPAAIMMDFDRRMTEAEQARDAQPEQRDLPPRERAAENITSLQKVTESLEDQVDRLDQAERAARRQTATANAEAEAQQPNGAMEQAQSLSEQAAVLQEAVQSDIRAMDAELADQARVIERAKEEAAKADALMRQLQAGLQLQNMQPATQPFSSGRGEPATQPFSSGRGEPATAPPTRSFRRRNVRVFAKSRDEFTSAERKSIEGDRIISLDFNTATNKSAKGVEIVIPSNATAAEKAAAQAYVDEVEAFFKKHGHDSYPNRGVKVSGKGVSGKQGYFHTEPFFIADAKAVEIIKENPAEYAQILAETLGILDGARFIAPHEKGAEGATGSIGSERAFALNNIIPELEKYMGEN